jgi:hypothetical protein
MPQYEYRVIPAPRRGEKARGLKTAEERFAHALTQLMNDLGREGWEYQRADTLPCDERVGLTGSKTTYQNLLVFRRQVEAAAPTFASLRAPAPEEAAPTLRLGPAVTPEGPARSLGPADRDHAAE